MADARLRAFIALSPSLPRNGLTALRAAASAEQLLARVQDVRFALDEIEALALSGVEPWSALRRDAIGMAGHSFGAQTTQALAGQRYSAAADVADPRLRAFIALSHRCRATAR